MRSPDKRTTVCPHLPDFLRRIASSIVARAVSIVGVDLDYVAAINRFVHSSSFKGV
jgi:hypothetical protein